MDKRILSLILLAHSSDVLENAFAPLQDDQYDLGMKRVHTLLELEPEKESAKPNVNELIHIWLDGKVSKLQVTGGFFTVRKLSITRPDQNQTLVSTLPHAYARTKDSKLLALFAPTQASCFHLLIPTFVGRSCFGLTFEHTT
ncbi:unnamed protein product [Pleuronectes platessa]|uniref:Uncharacterized protein n=1 Tax=Pleuronectes platessa TaxID=8262 RepID=A0A9N7VQB1_PLEPL|nr:unnamed protein product [Pleuronectes platessa]